MSEGVFQVVILEGFGWKSASSMSGKAGLIALLLHLSGSGAVASLPLFYSFFPLSLFFPNMASLA